MAWAAGWANPARSREDVSTLRWRKACREVTPFVQHAPDVESLVLLDVEDDERESLHRPGPQVRDAEFVGEPERAEVRLAGELAEVAFEDVDESRGDLGASLGEVVVHGELDVVRGDCPQVNRLVHRSAGGADAIAQAAEEGIVGHRPRRRSCPVLEERTQTLAVRVATNQLTDVLAGRVVPAVYDLGIHGCHVEHERLPPGTARVANRCFPATGSAPRTTRSLLASPPCRMTPVLDVLQPGEWHGIGRLRRKRTVPLRGAAPLVLVRLAAPTGFEPVPPP